MINEMMMTGLVGLLLLMMVTKRTDNERALSLETARRTLTGLCEQVELNTPAYDLMKQSRPKFANLATMLEMGRLMMVEKMSVLGRFSIPTMSERGFYPMNSMNQQNRAKQALRTWAMHMVAWAKHSVECGFCGCIGVSSVLLCPDTKTTMMARQSTQNTYVDGEYNTVVSDPEERNHHGSISTEWIASQTNKVDWELVKKYSYSNDNLCDTIIACYNVEV